MQIRDRIKELRTERNLTQQQLAEASGLHVQQISDLERGRGRPRIDTVEAIAKGLRVDAGQLLVPASKQKLPKGTRSRPRGRPPKPAPSTPPAGEREGKGRKARGRLRKDS
jgi:transcriptional regulator with XRE-family HTH domain